MKRLSKIIALVTLVLVIVSPVLFVGGCASNEISFEYVTYTRRAYDVKDYAYVFELKVTNDTKGSAVLYKTDFVVKAYYKNLAEEETTKQLACTFSNSADEFEIETGDSYSLNLQCVITSNLTNDFALDHVEILYKNKVIATNIVLAV